MDEPTRSRLTGSLAAPTAFDYAVILHPSLGSEIGGACIERHEDGSATVNWGGHRTRGQVVRFVPKGSV